MTLRLVHDYGARQIERRAMVDECVITTAVSASGTLDEDTLAVTFTEPTVLYAGPCSAAWNTSGQRLTTDGGADQEWPELIVRLPRDTSAGVLPGSVLTFTTSDLDPSLVDIELEVLDVQLETHRMSRRALCRRRRSFATTGGLAS